MAVENHQPAVGDLPHHDAMYHLAIELFANASALHEHLGLQVSVSITGVPRKICDQLMDHGKASTPGFVIAEDREKPLWMKRTSEHVVVYTREPPSEP